MLYDGAIAALQQASEALTAGDVAKKCAHLNRASAMIAQLEGTLNFELGGEVAKTLKSLYVYARGQILKGNIENSPEVLHALVEKFSTVREAWHEADRRPPEPAAAPGSEEAAGEEEPVQPASRPKHAGYGSPYAPASAVQPGSLRMTA
jgi:flagellar protein FliS